MTGDGRTNAVPTGSRLVGPLLVALGVGTPEIADDAWVAPGATLVGAVTLRARASIWYGAVVRGDGDAIEIGPSSNIQDGCVLHADPGFPVRLGRRVSVGHRAVVHGSVVEDNVLIGMGAVVLNGVHIGADCLVAAGTVLLEGTEVPPRSLVAGAPGRVRRSLTDDEVARVRRNSTDYEEMLLVHATV